MSISLLYVLLPIQTLRQQRCYILTKRACCSNIKSLWRPEYAAYMLEGTPGKPYGGLLVHFNVVEANMRYRRREATKLLGPNEVLMSLTNFPR